MKRLHIILLTALLFLVPSFAIAQKTPAQIATDIATRMAPSKPGGISALDFQAIYNDFVPSTFLNVNPNTGNISYYNGTAWSPYSVNSLQNNTVTDAMVSPTAAISATKLQFIQAGAGAISRSVDAKIKEGCISTGDFGMDPIATAAVNSAALMSAYTLAGTQGKACVSIVSGRFLMNPVVLNAYNNIAFVCQANGGNYQLVGGTRFVANGLTDNMITITSLGGITFRDCHWDSQSQQTAGSYLSVYTSTTIACEACTFNHGYDQVLLSDSAQMFFDHPVIRNTAHYGIKCTGASNATFGCSDAYILFPTMDQDGATGNTLPNVQAGIYIDNSQGAVDVIGGDIIHHHNNIWMNPANGTIVQWFYGIGTTVDTADFDDLPRDGVSFKITPHSNGLAVGNTCVNCWMSTGALASLQIQGDNTGRCSSNSIVQPQILHSLKTGIIIGGGCDKTSIIGPIASGASVRSPGTYPLIDILGDAKDVSIIGGTAGIGQFPGTQKFNLSIESGYSGAFTMVGTNISGSDSNGILGAYFISAGATPAAGSSITNSPGLNYSPIYTLTPGASPWTFGNALVPQTVYLSSTGSLTVSISGIPICVASPCQVQLDPTYSFVATYTGTLTARNATH